MLLGRKTVHLSIMVFQMALAKGKERL